MPFCLIYGHFGNIHVMFLNFILYFGLGIAGFAYSKFPFKAPTPFVNKDTVVNELYLSF